MNKPLIVAAALGGFVAAPALAQLGVDTATQAAGGAASQVSSPAADLPDADVQADAGADAAGDIDGRWNEPQTGGLGADLDAASDADASLGVGGPDDEVDAGADVSTDAESETEVEPES